MNHVKIMEYKKCHILGFRDCLFLLQVIFTLSIDHADCGRSFSVTGALALYSASFILRMYFRGKYARFSSSQCTEFRSPYV